MRGTKCFPVLDVLDELFCPHCGVKLATFDEGFLKSCPHLVYVFTWDDDLLRFDMVRPDFGRSLLKTLLNTFEYKVLMQYMIGPLSESDQEKFMQGDFSPQDSIGVTITDYGLVFPDLRFPGLLSSETVLYYIDHHYGGTHLSIDFGS
jgi:hypothetical protein